MRKLIVKHGPLLGRCQKSDLQNKQGKERDRSEYADHIPIYHEDEQHGDHGFNRVFTEDRAGKENDGRDPYAVPSHNGDSEYLFSDSLSVFKYQGYNELKQNARDQNTESDYQKREIDEHAVNPIGLAVL